jgi:hypothetical protein
MTEEACQKVLALKRWLNASAVKRRHPDDRELHDDWRASCRDLDLAAAALAELLGDRHTATWFRKRARP